LDRIEDMLAQRMEYDCLSGGAVTDLQFQCSARPDRADVIDSYV